MPIKKVGNIYPSGGEQGDIFDPAGICRTIKSGETSNPKHGGIGSSNSPKIVVSPCIRSEHHNTSDVHYIPKDSRIRRLTPTECERLQGFPDNWTAKGIDENGEEVKISDTQRYKCLGNAVSVPCVKAVAEKLFG